MVALDPAQHLLGGGAARLVGHRVEQPLQVGAGHLRLAGRLGRLGARLEDRRLVGRRRRQLQRGVEVGESEARVVGHHAQPGAHQVQRVAPLPAGPAGQVSLDQPEHLREVSRVERREISAKSSAPLPVITPFPPATNAPFAPRALNTTDPSRRRRS